MTSTTFDQTIDEAIASGERYREQRALGGDIHAVLAAPTKREVDFVFSVLSSLERAGVARPLIERCFGTLEVLLCVESLTLDGRHRQFVPLENQMECISFEELSRNPSAAESLLESVAFIPEPLYNRLKDEAEDFLDQLKDGGSSMESLIRKHSRAGGVLTKEGGVKEEGEDDA